MIDWRQYPNKRPYVDKEYLITYKTNTRGRGVTADRWLPIGCWDKFADFEVLAWAELPEPFKEKRNDKMAYGKTQKIG